MSTNNEHSSNSRRIARNTVFLYIRQLITMAVGLFTSRIVLNTLGETDFGIYGAVGGIVVVFSFLNGVMASACNRYFAIEIGKGDDVALRKVFCLNVTVFLAISVVIVLLSETIGLWFVDYKLVYPSERVVAVNWVYQLSILAFVVSMLTTPFRALIIAYENMKVFAYSSIAEAFLRLILVCALCIAPADKLILYACIMLIVNTVVGLFYAAYCWHCHPISRYKVEWDGVLFRNIVGYTSWNIIGSLAVIGKNQGVNLLLNIYFGPVVNAAQAIATQVSAVINQFSYNFMTAVSPQITKSYSVGNNDEMLTLMCRSSKYSYLLMLIIIMPILILLPYLLDVWLVDIPAGCVAFTQLTLINALVDSLSMPTAYAMQATGRVKWYQIGVGLTLLLIVPMSYVLIRLFNIDAMLVLVVSIMISIMAQGVRVLFVRHTHHLSLRLYVQSVVVPIILISIIAIVPPLLIMNVLSTTLTTDVVAAIVSVVATMMGTWFVGLSVTERVNIRAIIIAKFKQIYCHDKD